VICWDRAPTDLLTCSSRVAMPPLEPLKVMRVLSSWTTLSIPEDCAVQACVTSADYQQSCSTGGQGNCRLHVCTQKKKKNCRLHGISNFVSPKCQQRKFTILDTTIVKTLPDFLFKRTSLNYPRFCFLLLFEGEFSSLPPQLGLRGTYQHSCGCQTHP
jgi:hypothetical protein